VHACTLMASSVRKGKERRDGGAAMGRGGRLWREVGDDPDRWVPPVSDRGREGKVEWADSA
jgi:hypothetical protein